MKNNIGGTIMGLRVRKSIKIAPGVKINLGKKSAGISLGGKGFHYTVNSSGRKTTTVGIPGTGINYSTTSRKKHSNAKAKRKQLEREREKAAKDKEKQKQLELEHAKAVVEEYESKIDAITTIHRDCAEVILWDAIKQIPAPFEKDSQGPREIVARQKADTYKPGFFAKRIKAFDSAANGSLEKNILCAIDEDRKEYEEWETLNAMATGIYDKDLDVMLEIIGKMDVFDDLIEYGSGFEVGLLDAKTAEVEFDIMADTVVPKEEASLTATGKLSQKKLSVSKRLDIMQDYVCSCVLRIARDLFAILPLEAVLIHAKDTFLDTSLGNDIKQDILSVLITRDKVEKMNFDLIDPSDSMKNFECNMRFLKTKGFQPINRLDVDTE